MEQLASLTWGTFTGSAEERKGYLCPARASRDFARRFLTNAIFCDGNEEYWDLRKMHDEDEKELEWFVKDNDYSGSIFSRHYFSSPKYNYYLSACIGRTDATKAAVSNRLLNKPDFKDYVPEHILKNLVKRLFDNRPDSRKSFEDVVEYKKFRDRCPMNEDDFASIMMLDTYVKHSEKDDNPIYVGTFFICVAYFGDVIYKLNIINYKE